MDTHTYTCYQPGPSQECGRVSRLGSMAPLSMNRGSAIIHVYFSKLLKLKFLTQYILLIYLFS